MKDVKEWSEFGEYSGSKGQIPMYVGPSAGRNKAPCRRGSLGRSPCTIPISFHLGTNKHKIVSTFFDSNSKQMFDHTYNYLFGKVKILSNVHATKCDKIRRRQNPDKSLRKNDMDFEVSGFWRLRIS